MAYETRQPSSDVSAPDFAAFYGERRPGLWRLALARTGDAAAAEDLVQDVLADAQRRWATIGSLDDPGAWARRAVLNRSASWWRRRSSERSIVRRLGGRPQLAPAIPGTQLADEALWAAVRGLPTRQLEVALLLWFEDLSVAQVAEVLGCAEDTVRTHWRRARARLADELHESTRGEHDGS